jgi:hypothetical protein
MQRMRALLPMTRRKVKSHKSKKPAFLHAFAPWREISFPAKAQR